MTLCRSFFSLPRSYAGKLVLRLISHRSVLVPQISFLEAEVARISGQADDEYLSAIFVWERISGLQHQLGQL